MSYHDMFNATLQCIGSMLYGKECWFEDGYSYYSRLSKKNVSFDELLNEIRWLIDGDDNDWK